MPLNEIRDFIFEIYYKRIRCSNESSYYSFKCLKRNFLFLLTDKLIEKRLDSGNANKHYELFLR